MTNRRTDMQKVQFSDEQIMNIVKLVEATYYRWKARHGGMDVSQLHRLQQLKDENRRLKHLVEGGVINHKRVYGLYHEEQVVL